ncbi:trypsin-like peptidase domain-containing protein [Streptomyces sp. NPDC047916]|uniref:trypsin-like peptidase domain-containing protein n=1 Tax=Streptomyces sp. NPDC047916 TaxID=3156681 RepID=UPI003452F9CD
MEKENTNRPVDDSWVAAIHRAQSDSTSIGSGFTLDTYRVLTCAHVVRTVADADGELWVAFPKADERVTSRIRVSNVKFPSGGLEQIQDVAVLTLSSPIPGGCTPRLRCPAPVDLVGQEWWAFGFPGGDLLGNSASGTVGEFLGYGWVRLDTTSRYTVKNGFSGSPLWSPDYEAIVGMVGQATGDRGDARAISLRQIDRILPNEKIGDLAGWTAEAAGETALSSWGWSLRNDPEAGRHWRPRARGVSIETEQGFRFRGRSTALSKIVTWICEEPVRKALVVTGSPGVGKSAVLGRIVTTADAEIAAALPDNDAAIRTPIGAVHCAVHAKGKTALDVAVEISKAASAAIPEDIDYLPEYLREALTDRPNSSFNIVIDALDEATTGQQSRLIVRRILAPLVETCAHLGVRIVVGSRRRDDTGDLLGEFGRAITVLDLDDPSNFKQEDLEAYTLATLQLTGDERSDSPYSNDEIAWPIAQKIAAMADHNFLVAGLVARSHGLHDAEAVAPLEISFTPTVDGALRDYLDRIEPVGGCRSDLILAALAFAEAPGFSITLWRIAVEALSGQPFTVNNLSAFAHSSAANFLVETNADQGDVVYRLFHQALNDTLIDSRSELYSRKSDESALAQAMITEGAKSRWADTDPYLRRSLARHAELGGVLDTLLEDDRYLLYADLRRLVPVTDRVDSELARQKTKLIRRTPRALNSGHAERIGLLSVTEAQQQLGRSFQDLDEAAPYRASWSSVIPGSEEALLEGHTRWSYILCSFEVAGQHLLASAGGDRTVRIWDPVLCEVIHVLEGHTDEVRAITQVRLGDQDSLATAGRDGTIRFWDPVSGDLLHSLDGFPEGFSTLNSLVFGTQGVLIGASAVEAEVSLIDPTDGAIIGALQRHEDWVSDICEVSVSGRRFVASCSEDGKVHLWNLSESKIHLTISLGHWEWARSLCSIEVGGHQFLAGACYDGAVRLWDPLDGALERVLIGHEGSALTICEAKLSGKSVLVSGSDDQTLRIWDPSTGQTLKVLHGHTDWIYSVRAVGSHERGRLASTGDDRSIRLWDPETGEEKTLVQDAAADSFELSCVLQGSNGPEFLTALAGNAGVVIRSSVNGQIQQTIPSQAVYSMCELSVGGSPRLAVGGSRFIELWNPETLSKTYSWPLSGYGSQVSSLCTLKVFDDVLMAGAVRNSILFWGLSRNSPVHHIRLNLNVRDICPVPIDGRKFLSCLGYNGQVQIVNPRIGEVISELAVGQNSTVQCLIQVGGRVLLSTGSDEGVIQLWDPENGKRVGVLEGHSARLVNIWPYSKMGHSVLVSAGNDRSVRIWDPIRFQCLADIPLYHSITWASQVGDTIMLSLNAGMFGIAIDILHMY